MQCVLFLRTPHWYELVDQLGSLAWLVDWTPLKNISQLGWLFPIYRKTLKKVPNHQPVDILSHFHLPTSTSDSSKLQALMLLLKDTRSAEPAGSSAICSAICQPWDFSWDSRCFHRPAPWPAKRRLQHGTLWLCQNHGKIIGKLWFNGDLMVI